MMIYNPFHYTEDKIKATKYQITFDLDDVKCYFIYSKLQEIIDFGYGFIYNHIDNNLDNYISTYHNNNIVEFIHSLLINDAELSYNFGIGYSYASIIINNVGYPWNINLTNIIYAYLKNNVDDEYVNIFFNLLKKTKHLVDAEILKAKESIEGSLKWQEYADKAIKMFSDIIEEVVGIEKCEKTIGTYEKPWLTYKFITKRNIIGDKHIEIHSLLRDRLTPIYQRIKPIVRSLNDVYGLQTIKVDNTNKTFIVSFKSNDWEALGLNPDAQFLPTLGKKN